MMLHKHVVGGLAASQRRPGVGREAETTARENIMRVTEVEVLYRYNEWANGRVLDAAEHVSAADLVGPAPESHGSLLGTLAHALSSERVWRIRSQEGRLPAPLSIVDFPTLATLRERWTREAEAMRAFLNVLHDEDLDGLVRYTSTQGITYAMPLWQVLLHVVNHGTQTRSEAAQLLTHAGHSPGDLDLMAYLRSA
jgi:uncharacterized damage-inducible protein DinB